VRRRLGGDHMVIVHAVMSLGGLAVLLLATVGLVVGAVILGVSAHRRSSGRRRADPWVVPVWWDQAGSS
jgi:glucose uptake protein GlcU